MTTELLITLVGTAVITTGNVVVAMWALRGTTPDQRARILRALRGEGGPKRPGSQEEE